jgi:hypothetical protein
MKKFIILIALIFCSTAGQSQNLPQNLSFYPHYFDGSAGCGNSTASASWALMTFRTDGGGGGLFETGYSSDGLNYCYDLSQTGLNLRDPRLLKYSGTWYIFYSDTTLSGGSNTAWGCRSSTDLKGWGSETLISVTGGVPSATDTWAPSYFIDTDDSLHVLVAISTNTRSSFQIYETHPTGSGNLCAQTWSNPSAITVTSQTSLIDPWVTCIDSTGVLCTAGSASKTYYLFYTNLPGTEYVQEATSTTLTGTYTNIETGNWAGWFSSVLEGPQLIDEGSGNWRMLLDVTDGGLASGQLNYSDCSSGLSCFSGSPTWSAPRALATGPYQAKHGTVYPYP